MTTATVTNNQIIHAPIMWKTGAKSQEEDSFNNYCAVVYESIRKEEDFTKLIQYFHFYITERKISQKNLKLIEFLDQWMAEPDDLGEDFWKEFCEDLEKNRFTI